MNLCSDSHDEICYEGNRCPACELLTERENLQEEIENLEDEINSLKADIDELKAEIEGLEN